MRQQTSNWAGNYSYSSKRFHEPQSIEEVQELVSGSRRIKVLGSRHSFNSIGDTDEDHLSLAKLDRVIDLDRANGRVTVEGGIRYGELCTFLHENGYALHNLASLPHITIAGACATGTHGSGNGNGNLATAVHAMELVKGNGETIQFTRDQSDAELAGAAIGLGALGVVTKLTLNVLPSFDMTQHVCEGLQLARLDGRIDEVFALGYSVSLFTDWRASAFNQVWLKRLAGAKRGREETDAEELLAGLGASLSRVNLNPVPGSAPLNCSEQCGIPGPWHERLPHFRMNFTPSSGNELQSEYFVARKDVYDALRALDSIREQIAPLLMIAETRTIAADDLWMSPCYDQDSAAFHFTWKPDTAAVRRLLPLMEDKLEPFGVRPHWSKLFEMEPKTVRGRYSKLPDFQALAGKCDPERKFGNEFLESYIY
ncbi:FAD-binding protein [Paenibacillus sp. HB172176]|uniref:FAD-binding protein n=1 Tax=Paenibacillus sp. HB172176 TaxID=2493690 RepID=UPI00143CAE95|nr:FAD-binding protein [Paenibacillus sp. HB172176]